MPDVRCGDLRVHWEEWGSGPPIIWIPGTGLRGRTWEPQIAQFQKTHRCLAVDLRGSGDTKGGRDNEFTVAALAWSDGWDVGDADLLGDSMRRLRGQVGRIIWCDPHAAAVGYQPQVQGLCGHHRRWRHSRPGRRHGPGRTGP